MILFIHIDVFIYIQHVVCTKQDIEQIINESRSQFGIDSFRVGFVAYRDWFGDGERIESLPFTQSIDEFKQFVGNLKAQGGDDAAEDVLGGLQSSINLNWKSNIKILYHICDAPPHGTIYHDLFHLKSGTIDGFLTSLQEMIDNEDDDDDDSDSDSDDEDFDNYNNAFIQSKINLTDYDLNDEEKSKLDKFPNKHKLDPDHMDLLNEIKNKNIKYYIGEKTCHVDKFINLMISDGKKINLKINRIEVPTIKQLFPTLLKSIQYSIKLSSNQDINKLKKNLSLSPKSNRLLQINKKSNFKVHVGIDFGTDGSAIAIALPNNKVEISTWGSNHEFTKTKTNILLSSNGQIIEFGTNAADIYSNSIKDNDKYDQQEEDSTDDDDDDDDDDDSKEYNKNKNKNNDKPMFFEKFKMCLYDNNNQSEEKQDISEQIRCIGGRYYSSVKVLTAALTFMKNKALSIVNKKPYNIDSIDNIQWVVTVPAIWSNKSKYIMIKCAQNAGMIYKSSSSKQIDNHLIIALEPDCASLSIRNNYNDLTKKYNRKQKENDSNNKNKNIFQKGDRYLLLDLGGGTADIACHEIVDESHVKEIRSPSGGPWGSAYIDKEFEKLLKIIFKPKWIDRFEKKYPDKYVSLLNSFRFRKQKFTFGQNSIRFNDNFQQNNLELFTMNSMAFIQFASENKSENERKYHNIKLPFEFTQEIEKYIEKDMKNLINNDNDNDDDEDDEDDDDEIIEIYFKKYKLFNKYKNLIKSDGEFLSIEESIMRYLFDIIIDKIINHCRKLLNEELLISSKYILLVGGFSESLYLQNKILFEFGPLSYFKKKILTQKRPILCVVDGAARFGLKPNYILSRTMTKTYGISIQKDIKQFKKSYPNIKLDKNIGGNYVNNCFFPFVRRNDIIRIDDEPKIFYFQTVDKNNFDKIEIKLYESDKINPIFTNNKSSSLMAQKIYKLPKDWQIENENNNTIPVSFFFAGSTIRVFIFFGDKKYQKEIVLECNV